MTLEEIIALTTQKTPLSIIQKNDVDTSIIDLFHKPENNKLLRNLENACIENDSIQILDIYLNNTRALFLARGTELLLGNSKYEWDLTAHYLNLLKKIVMHGKIKIFDHIIEKTGMFPLQDVLVEVAIEHNQIDMLNHLLNPSSLRLDDADSKKPELSDDIKTAAMSAHLISLMRKYISLIKDNSDTIQNGNLLRILISGVLRIKPTLINIHALFPQEAEEPLYTDSNLFQLKKNILMAIIGAFCRAIDGSKVDTGKVLLQKIEKVTSEIELKELSEKCIAQIDAILSSPLILLPPKRAFKLKFEKYLFYLKQYQTYLNRSSSVGEQIQPLPRFRSPFASTRDYIPLQQMPVEQPSLALPAAPDAKHQASCATLSAADPDLTSSELTQPSENDVGYVEPLPASTTALYPPLTITDGSESDISIENILFRKHVFFSAELTGAKREISELNKKLSVAGEQIAQLSASREAADAQIEAMRLAQEKQAKQFSQELQASKAQVETKDLQIHQFMQMMSAKFAALQNTVDAQDQKIAAQAKDIAALGTKVDAKDGIIAAQTKEMAAQEKEIAALKQSIVLGAEPAPTATPVTRLTVFG